MNKKLFVWTIIVAFAWGVLYYFITAPLKEDVIKLRDDLRKTRLSIGLRRGGSADVDRLEKITEDQKRIEKETSVLKDKLLFKPRPEYQAERQTENLLIRFKQLIDNKYSELYKMALTRGIKKFPNSLGFPKTTSQAELPLYFERVDVIDQTIKLLIETGCSEIYAITPDRDAKDFKDFVDPSILLNDLIRKDVVVVKFRTDFKSAGEIIYKLNSFIRRGERFLVSPRISLESDTADTDIVTMTIAVGGLKSNEVPK